MEQRSPARTSLGVFAFLYVLLGECRAAPQELQIVAKVGSSVVDATTGGMPTIASIGTFASINDDGVIAFIGTQSDGKTGVYKVESGVITRVTNIDSSYFGVSLSKTDLATRDGSAVSGLIRRWPLNVGTPVTVANTLSTGPTPSSVQLWLDINNSGTVALYGLDIPSAGIDTTRLVAGTSLPPTVVAEFTGTVALRPQISDDNRIVVRDNAGRILRYDFTPGVPLPPENVVASSSSLHGGFSSVGMMPGISGNGRAVAFSGVRNGLPGLFVDVRDSGGVWNLVPVLGDGHPAGVTPIADARVAVTASVDVYSATPPLAPVQVDRLAIVFLGSYLDGGVPQTGLFGIGVTIDPSVTPLVVDIGEPVLLAGTGQAVGTSGQTISSISVYDPLNEDREVAARLALSDGSAVVARISPRGRSVVAQPLGEKFKQFTPWGMNCVIPNSQPNDMCMTLNMQNYGCLIAAFATGVSIVRDEAGLLGTVPDPLDVRDQLFEDGCITSAGDTIITSATYVEGSFAVWVKQANVPPASTFASIKSQLEQGRLLVLLVPSANPSMTATDFLNGKRRHYVLAYGYDRDVGLLYGEAHGVLINDPGLGASGYYLPGVKPSEVNPGVGAVVGTHPGFSMIDFDKDVHISLADYFGLVTRRASSKSFDLLLPNYFGGWGDEPLRDNARIREWFDSRHFYRIGSLTPEVVPLPNANLVRVICSGFYDLLENEQLVPGGLPGPTVSVASPVAIRLTDPSTGVRYVSHLSIAGTGDVLLERSEVDPVDPPDSDVVPGPTPQFPAYVVRLPSSLTGKDIAVEAIGLGNGNFAIHLHPVGSTFDATSSFSGQISTGQVLTTTLTVGAILSAPWTDLGGARPGVAGEPVLVGLGSLVVDEPGALRVFSAAPNSTSLMFVAHQTTTPTPLPTGAGTFHPLPIWFVAPIPLDQSGAGECPFYIPASMFPSGMAITIQVVVQDPIALDGFSMTNAIVATIP